MSKPGTDVLPLLREIRCEKASGKIYKRFEDDYFALDLLRIVYDDSVENNWKTELLIVVEEYGYLGVAEDCVDQIVTSLLDIYHQTVDQTGNWTLVCQILVTCTSLIIQLQQLASELCETVVKELVTIVTSRLNQPTSHRLRSCACQCLIHLEEFKPGLLVQHYDDFCQLAKRERCDVYQDYALLVAKVLASTCSVSDMNTSGGAQQDLQKHIAYELQDVRPMAAYLVENIALCTRSGTYRLIECLTTLVKHSPEVSPMIFKPPMLHQMCTMSCTIFHTVLYLQHEFEGEILSVQEEAGLVHRLCCMTNHPCLNQLHRLLACQWAHKYQLKDRVDEKIVENHRLMFYPSVFDSIDTQLRKLYMTALCGDTSQDTEGVETSILLGSLGCLHKMVWHTGSELAARALFKALYFIYIFHNNTSFSKDIQRFVRGLISEFAHFIPHSIDFADSINGLDIDSHVYIDTLSLLHQQVVMATEEQICHSYQFYLLIMKKAGSHKEIDEKPTVNFLSYLAEKAALIDDSSWRLGHGILEICRNIMVCHGTHACFVQLGDLLYYMMTSYNDTDVQDKARLYYALITGATDNKMEVHQYFGKVRHGPSPNPLTLGDDPYLDDTVAEVHSVLKTSLGDVESMNQTIASLLPGTTDRVSLAQIIPLEEPVFSLQRISVTASVLKAKDVIENTDDSAPVVQYEEHLDNLQVVLDVVCRLTLREDSDFLRAYAVSIHVETSPVFHPIPNRHVACLTRTGCQEILLQVVPKLPIPQILNCSVEFCSDNKQTYGTVLLPLDVDFPHLLMQLPWKPDGDDILTFSMLREWVLNRKLGERGSIESVKLFSMSIEKYKLIHKTHLSHFLFEGDTGASDSGYAMFLPPCYHVLLKCHNRSTNCLVVSIATDLWTLLPYIDKFLGNIMS